MLFRPILDVCITDERDGLSTKVDGIHAAVHDYFGHIVVHNMQSSTISDNRVCQRRNLDLRVIKAFHEGYYLLLLDKGLIALYVYHNIKLILQLGVRLKTTVGSAFVIGTCHHYYATE